MNEHETPVVALPVLPLRNTILFPGLFLPLSVGRPSSVAAVVEALHQAILELAGRALELVQPQTPINLQQLAAQAGDPLQLAYLIASMMSLDVAREQAILEAPTRVEALRLLHGYLSHELQVLELRHKIASQAQSEM